MSVFFSEVKEGSPVRKHDAEQLLHQNGIPTTLSHPEDYHVLLSAIHDCAEQLDSLPDYQPVPDRQRFPRQDIHLPTESEQAYGHAWAHKFLIQGSSSSSSSSSPGSSSSFPPSLAGKKVCLKDCIAVADVPQFFGSDAFPAWTPSTDATVVTRILSAGGNIHGTAVCESFCNSTSSFTSSQGTIENPRAKGYSAGGSTSGGAALVAGGVMDIALGTDQGGSIRVPASLCGCVGLKPTHGLVPYTGITSGDAVDDHAGPLARSVGDVAKVLDAVAGYDGIDDRSLGAGEWGGFGFAKALSSSSEEGEEGDDDDVPLKGLRIGVLREGTKPENIQPGVLQLVLAAAEKFRSLGAEVKEISVPAHRDGPLIWTIQQRIAGAAGVLGHSYGRRGLYLTEFEKARLPWTPDNFQKLFPSTANTVINGLYLSPDRFPGLYGKSMNHGRRIRDAFEKAFKEDVDLIIMPTTPRVAPRHGTRDSPRTCLEPSIGLTSNTAVFNVTGHPAMSIPVGSASAADDEKLMLPVGMQIVGGLWQEKTVLKAGHAWEMNFKWEEFEASGKDAPKM